MKGTKQLIKQLKDEIKKENVKINNLYGKIDEYEVIKSIIQDSKSQRLYNEKINHCYLEIEKSVDNIQYNRDAISKIKIANQIVKRSENCA